MFRTHNADLIPEQLSAAEEFFREYADDIARGHTSLPPWAELIMRGWILVPPDSPLIRGLSGQD